MTRTITITLTDEKGQNPQIMINGGDDSGNSKLDLLVNAIKAKLFTGIQDLLGGHIIATGYGKTLDEAQIMADAETAAQNRKVATC